MKLKYVFVVLLTLSLSVCAHAQSFKIKDAKGAQVAAIDSSGNLTLSGSLVQNNQTVTPSSSKKEYIVKASSAVLMFTNVEVNGDVYDPDYGKMYLAGVCATGISTTALDAVSCISFRIKNASGNTVALINSEDVTINDVLYKAGSLLLAGSVS